MNENKEFRTAAMNKLDQLRSIHGEIIPYIELKKGFQFQGGKVHFLGPQGIFKPAQMDLPLTITTTYNGPYEDSFGEEFLNYKYRGTTQEDINHPENEGLRICMEKRIPLIYFHGVEVGRYLAIYPVFIIDKDDSKMEFTVAADDIRHLNSSEVEDKSAENGRRRYVTREVKTRIHQNGFRARVMKAYHETCAFCRLKHASLLDAAHIIPDSEKGSIQVQNGMALCKIHHAAFDQNILGVDPNYKIHVREDILQEIDGPMLKYGLQKLNNTVIHKPRGKNKPSKDFLDIRYQAFKSA